MTIAVRYYTLSGNTEKLACAIADALGLKAETVAEPLQEKVDILFLGCSYYAFDVDESIKKFVAENREKIGLIVCFGTSAMMRSILRPMRRVAKANGVTLYEKDFHCRGAFKKAHPGRPNAEDLAEAVAFARSVLG